MILNVWPEHIPLDENGEVIIPETAEPLQAYKSNGGVLNAKQLTCAKVIKKSNTWGFFNIN